MNKLHMSVTLWIFVRNFYQKNTLNSLARIKDTIHRHILFIFTGNSLYFTRITQICTYHLDDNNEKTEVGQSVK